MDESPGEIILYQGERFKEYRGMGSLGAMKQRSPATTATASTKWTTLSKLVPEGIEARVQYKGPLGTAALPAGRRPAARHGLRRRADIDTLHRNIPALSASPARASAKATPTTWSLTKEAPNYGQGR